MKRTVLITGAGRGIGRALAAFASEQGADVVALMRTHVGGVLPCEVIEGIDVTDKEALDRVAAILKERSVDLLVNNAGIIGPERQSTLDMDFDGFRRAFEVNTLAPLRVAQIFLPNLRAARDRSGIARIVTISSQMGRMNYAKSDRIAYRASKTAVNKVMQALATDLAPESIAVRVVEPGWAKTDMGGPDATVRVADAVAGIHARAWELSLESTGTFVDYRGTVVSW
ncbi:SDR family NAD(P)-dependent oxidoreductase [Mesorhizobium sp. M1A.F.Ca.IN.020.30.1.1]|uniref:SDR family NAD(P)-dependent oxidoreductase n=1 Tax=unclassified Mesorhizobium TaxID=325217 RepID=UPI000FD2762D|nr:MULTISPECIES: SDR family NAD(P)-dependent oxidoreductase [unclassified Mesorhizobium]RUV77919.1 SDR family NAD(P)-dependent oxidoreductase [Mesorhizobium sp. M1A.F.Ca.IN.020.30.1.1]RWG43306.1 MAG: SDR family NAD(P)-dependent oxidoreductase [Mesorhizobium sp.]RWG70074.1 MAG: SDR family NAD(P)-dependent oxidoreductase [Mesorhizobium sp.]TIM76606.1 MAG: SDR family NAD(P)-dependent oxidoreductase [Mesorhizobium sp.]TIM93205.1 MAG: SDR family NAD(P)-dependent oxidoreductase [Mesorhizobium sp.]